MERYNKWIVPVHELEDSIFLIIVKMLVMPKLIYTDHTI